MACLCVFVALAARADAARGAALEQEGRQVMEIPTPYPYRLGSVMYRETFESAENWQAEEGDIALGPHALRLGVSPLTRATLTAFPHNRVGGNVAYRFRFRLLETGENWSFGLNANAFDQSVNILSRRPGADERFQVYVEDAVRYDSAKGGRVRLQDKAIPIDWRPEPGREHEIRLVNVGRYKEVLIDGVKVASAWIQKPWVASEGHLSIEVRQAALELTSFNIVHTYWDVPRKEFEAGELLFADDFSDVQKTKQLWAYEYKKQGDAFLPPLVRDGWLHAERFSAVWCRRAFDGPVIYSFECRPIPEDPDDPASITDAIFFFQASWYNMPFDFFSRKHYDTRTSIYGDLRAYWMDWGGNGNATTRLRKLPYRHLMRQNIAPEDQLIPGRVHRVRMICAGSTLRFEVDGRTLVENYDLTPYTHGHFGLLGYVRATRIRDFKVHRAKATAPQEAGGGRNEGVSP